MGILDSLRDTLLGEEEAVSRSYQCLGCRETFESTANSTGEARCPDCGSEDARVVVGGQQGDGFGQH
jgi:DNA-directed RNA polymerase subunit RPC12/RpoP